MKKDVLKIAKMTPGEEIILVKNVEETQSASIAGPIPKQTLNIDNNNTVPPDTRHN